MKRFIFVTHHNSVVTVRENGVLGHQYAGFAEPNLLFDESGHVIAQPEVADQKFTYSPALIESRHTFALKDGTLFLCAVPDGTFSLRKLCNAWEKFNLVPVEVLEATRQNIPQEFPRKQRRSGVSKIIHQTFSTGTIPDAFAENASALRTSNPNWKYRYWNDKDIHDFIYDCYGWDILRKFLRINPRYGAARADLFRYLCLYHFGGVYLDIKSSCNMPLDELIDTNDQYLLCKWDNREDKRYSRWGTWPELSDVPGGEYQQWHIISCPGHPFLAAVIDAVLQNIEKYEAVFHGVGKRATLRITGPIAYTKAIHPILHEHDHRIIEPSDSPLIYVNVSGYERKLGSHYIGQSTPLVL